MERVTKECARYLVQHLDPENCIEIRSLPGIARNKTFVAQVDSYIATQVKQHHVLLLDHTLINLAYKYKFKIIERASAKTEE